METNPTMHINDLPEEVLYLLFSMLPVEQLVTSIQHVCRHWLTISHDWRLWENYTFSPNTKYMTEVEIVKFLKQAPMLRSFAPAKYVDVKSCIDTICAYCPNVRNLKIICDGLSLNYVVGDSPIIKMFKELNGLESVNFISGDHVWCNETFECISSSCTLKSLEISGRGMFYEMDGKTVWKLLADGVPTLEKIIINVPTEDEITIEDLTYLVERKQERLTAIRLVIPDLNDCHINQILQCEKLQTLHIYSKTERNVCLNRLGELSLNELSLEWLSHGIEELLSSKSWIHLRKLNLSGSKSNDATVNLIVNQCPALNSLQLDMTLITGRGLKDLHKMHNLQHISVKDCEFVTDDTVMDMASCPNLISVNLSGCDNLTDGALGHLLTRPSLREIRMDDCPHLTGEPFKLIPAHLPDLKLLSVDDYESIDVECLQKLRAAMPNLELVAQIKYNEHEESEIWNDPWN